MKYVSEDKIGTPLSKLLSYHFPAGHIDYKSGVSRIPAKIKRDLSCGEHITAFIDLPAGNDKVIIEYYRILDLQEKFPDQLNVVPIFCIEHSLLQFLYDDNLIDDPFIENATAILNILRIAPRIEELAKGTASGSMSIEGRAKELLQDGLSLKCFHKENGKGDTYAILDCTTPQNQTCATLNTCKFKRNFLQNEHSCYLHKCDFAYPGSLSSKSKHLLRCMPYFPNGSLISEKESIDPKDSSSIIRYIVEICNKSNNILNETVLKDKLYIRNALPPKNKELVLDHFDNSYLTKLQQANRELDELTRKLSIPSIESVLLDCDLPENTVKIDEGNAFTSTSVFSEN